MSFVTDLKQGQDTEDKFIELLKEKYNYIQFWKPIGNFPFFDIAAVNKKGKIITFEIKSDKRSDETGNVCFELRYNKKYSGVITSSADYVVYYLFEDNNYYQYETNDLRRFLWQNEDSKKFKVLNGGDKYKSKLLLLPIKDFKNIFTQL